MKSMVCKTIGVIYHNALNDGPTDNAPDVVDAGDGNDTLAGDAHAEIARMILASATNLRSKNKQNSYKLRSDQWTLINRSRHDFLKKNFPIWRTAKTQTQRTTP